MTKRTPVRLNIYLFGLVWLGCSTLSAQIFRNKEIPFLHANNATLQFPLLGGMDNIQANEMDLDGDGIQDLLFFDRAGDVLLPLLYRPSSRTYQYAPGYKRNFPKIKDWLVCKDYNQDGLTDLFSSSFNTEGIPGIEVYTAARSGQDLQFTKFDMGKQFKVLFFPIGTSFTQIPVDFSDLPAIDDVDFDGDLDIILFEPGNNRLSWFQNVVKERGFKTDTLAFVLTDRCYGKFVESGFTSDIVLSGRIDTCAGSFAPISTTRHAGSTVLSLNLNGDSLRDLLIGDLTNTGLIGLYNGGQANLAFMTSQLTHWPGPEDPVDMAIFMGASSIDVDHDGVMDVLVSPNQRTISENADNLWYYRNAGSESNPDFQLQSKGFIANEMLDLGSGSDPCFVDYNQDGLMDILVGTEGYFIRGSNLRDARLFLFENVGAEALPVYKLVDSNYLGFNEFALSQDAHHSFSPAVGDLDGDFDLDLLVGENQGQFFYCENIAGPGTPFRFKKTVYPYADLSVKSNSSPFLTDLNRDGLVDIVSGAKVNTNDINNKACGSFYYFQNQGSRGNPVFDPDYYKAPNTNCLGKIIVNSLSSKSYTCPEIFDFGGNYKLFSGNIFGELKMIGNIENNIGGNFVMENPNFGQILEGERLTLSLADLDGDSILEMVTGNSRGGLAIYQTSLKTDGTTAVTEEYQSGYKLYPNPSFGVLRIANESGRKLPFMLMDLHGRLHSQGTIDEGSVFEGGFDHLPDGVYLVRLFKGDRNETVKWIKISE